MLTRPEKNKRHQTKHLPLNNTIQTKLKIGKPDDKYEQEADRVADKVMMMPEKEEVQMMPNPSFSGLQMKDEQYEEDEEPVQTKLIQRQADDEEEELQAKEQPGQTPQAGSGVESRINSLKGGGQPLDPATRTFFEPRFGYDLSQVRVHTDAQAGESTQALNARAYSLGRNVVFGDGQYAPRTSRGNRLLAHEITHVVQQGAAKKLRQTLAKQATQVEGSVGSGAIQLSPLSNEVQNLWLAGNRGAFFARLRTLGTSDVDVYDFVANNLTGDERWLAMNLASYGPEANWQLGPRIEREFGRGFPDYTFGGMNVVLQVIHAANLSERQTVLGGSNLSAIRSRAGTNAFVVVAALLEGSMTWHGPSGADPANQYRIAAGSTFASWILGRDEAVNRPDVNSTMNCWEGVMFASYLAGRATYAQLLDLHDRMASAGQTAAASHNPDNDIQNLVQQIRTQYPSLSRPDAEATAIAFLTQRLGPNYRQRLVEIAGSGAYNDLLRSEFGVSRTNRWQRGNPAPPAGNLVFFKNDPIVHVAISLGTQDSQNRSQLISLWTQPGGISNFQRTTIEEVIAVAPGQMQPVTFGPSPW